MTLILSYTPPGTPGGPPTLDEAVALLRRDLFDLAEGLPVPGGGTTPPRWSDDDLVRAIDRAVDEYSHAMPLMQSVMTATLPGTRAYALPPGAWWVESVEYPSGLHPLAYVPFREVATPGLGTPQAAPVATAGTGVGPLTGTYAWALTFFKSGSGSPRSGETLPGPASGSLALAGGAALLDAIPTGPPGTVGRNVYRATIGAGDAPGPFRLAGTILDNTTTAWTDAVPDARLGPAPPLADTTANLPQVVLRLPSWRVPSDTSGVITVSYATRHELAPAGSSIPAWHRDVVLQGAAAYAMLAYQAPTNDLFEYQDGELRDRVDERGVPGAWLAAATHALNRFERRLSEIKRERNAGIAGLAQWGDVPVRWSWT